MATIPDALPPEYAAELTKLQSQAPPMGWAFVKRRMKAELGADWQKKFASFEHHPAAAASLGQVHRAARASTARELACKLQYPDMQSAVEADLQQLQLLFAIHRRMDPAIDTTEIAKEIGARMREELDYRREAKHVALYRAMLDGIELDPRAAGRGRSSRPGGCSRSTGSKGAGCSSTRTTRSQCATGSPPRCSPPGGFRSAASASSTAIRISAITRCSTTRSGRAGGINLLDYGCIRIFPPRFVGGVVDLYHGLLHGDDDLVVHAYETWGFKRLSRELIDVLNIWARFIYGPLLDDRVRTIADGVKPVRIRPPGGLPGAPGAEGKGAGDGAARIRVHGPRRDRARRRVPAPARGAQFLPAVQRGDRGFLDRARHRAPGRGARGGRARARATVHSGTGPYRKPARRADARRCSAAVALPEQLR